MMKRRIIYVVIILLAVIAAAAGYGYFRYPPSMLVLQVKTFEKGVRSINVVDGNGKAHLLSFEIGNDSGEPCFYPIDLPRLIPQEVRIAPLAGRNRFEIDRITLKNEELSYSWDSQGVCTRKGLPDGIIKREPCGDNQPIMTMAGNSELSISRIPLAGYGINMTKGIVAGVCSFFVTLIAGFWLCRPVKADRRRDQVAVFLARSCWLLLLTLYLAQLFAIWQYSVDIPFWEEWEYFLPEGLPKGLSWDWLFGFAGYHRVVLTKFMAWVNLHLFGLDFRLQKLFNYLIFGGLLFTLVSLKNRVIGKNDFLLFPAFLLFLLSPIAYENHYNSYQSQIHLVILFTLIALFHIYSDSLKTRSQIIFFLCLVAAINTFSAGMTVSALFLPCWAIFVMAQIAAGRIAKQKGIVLLLLGGVVVTTVAASWISGYSQPSDCIWISPFSGRFWDTFLNLISFGFGFEIEHPLPGIICLIIVLVPLIMLWSDKERRRQERVWQVSTALLCILAILATISITRGNFIGTSKMSRYVEFGLLLIPLTSMAWWLALKRVVLRGTVLLFFWLACFGSFSDDWSYSPYRDAGQMGQFVLENLEEYLHGRSDGAYPWSHPEPLPPFFEAARRLDVKFTRQFKGLHRESQR